jgi:hypothetical protein
LLTTGPQVISASYGDPTNPARRKDVTDLVRQDLARGLSTITAHNGWAGGDPALKTPKKFWVVLRGTDGREQRLEARESEPLLLVESVPTPRPAGEVLDGGARLLAWEQGGYRATRENGTTVNWTTRAPRRMPLSGPWQLAFPAGWGAPASLRLDKLSSWTELELAPEARAFSGTATYTTEFTLDPLAAGARVELDLGRVEVMAGVRLNDEPVGTVWTVPGRLDLTRRVKPGVNRLTVAVTSTWFNRLVYDAGLDEKARKTWTISGPAKGRAFLPAGLLGPVVLRIGQTLEAAAAQ